MSAYPIPINIESPGANLEAYVRAVNAISVLSVEEERALAERLLKGLGAEKFAVLAGAIKSDPAVLADEAGAISLFGGKRAIWVEPAGDEIADRGHVEPGAHDQRGHKAGRQPVHRRKADR